MTEPLDETNAEYAAALIQSANQGIPPGASRIVVDLHPSGGVRLSWGSGEHARSLVLADAATSRLLRGVLLATVRRRIGRTPSSRAHHLRLVPDDEEPTCPPRSPAT